MDMQPTVAYWSVFLFIGYRGCICYNISIRWDMAATFSSAVALTSALQGRYINTVNLLLY